MTLLHLFNLVEATDEEVRASSSRSGKPAASKASAKAKGKGAKAKTNRAMDDGVENNPTPMKDNKRCSKGPPPENTPEKDTGSNGSEPKAKDPPKRARSKQPDPNQNAQIDSLKQALQGDVDINCISDHQCEYWLICYVVLLCVFYSLDFITNSFI